MSDAKIISPPKSTKLVELSIQNGDSGIVLTLSLLDPAAGVSSFRFNGVRQLTLNSLGPGSNLGPLKAISLERDQLEGIRFKIMDYEEEHLSFLCSSVD